MATVQSPCSVHLVQLPPLCPLAFALYFGHLLKPYMSWKEVWDFAAHCVPHTCIKFLVICIANTLMATGWLMLSIFSILGSLVPTVAGVPPTLPQLTSNPKLRNAVVQGVAQIPPQAGDAAETGNAQKVVAERPPVRTHSPHVKFVEPEGVHPDGHPHLHSPPPNSVLLSSSRDSASISTSGSSDSELPDQPGNLPNLPKSPLCSENKVNVVGDTNPRGRPSLFHRISDRHKGRARSSGTPTRISKSATGSPERAEDTPQPQSPLNRTTSAPQRLCHNKKRTETSPKPPPKRTDPYQAPYFFPSPLSPDAADYVSRVRAERKPSSPTVLFPRAPPRTQSDPSTSESVAHSVESSQQTHAIGSGETETETTVVEAQPKSRSRPSWPKFHLHHHHESERPLSWSSDVPTSESSMSAESSGHSPRPKLKSLWRRSTGSRVTQLGGPLTEEPSPIAPSPSLSSKKSWHLRFHHHRTPSVESHDSRLPEPVSEFGVRA